MTRLCQGGAPPTPFGVPLDLGPPPIGFASTSPMKLKSVGLRAHAGSTERVRGARTATSSFEGFDCGGDSTLGPLPGLPPTKMGAGF
jgi:hypothetical protein